MRTIEPFVIVTLIMLSFFPLRALFVWIHDHILNLKDKKHDK